MYSLLFIYFFPDSEHDRSPAEDVMAAQQKPQPTQAIDQALPPPPQIPRQEIVPPASAPAQPSINTMTSSKVLTTPAVRRIAKDNQVDFGVKTVLIMEPSLDVESHVSQ